MISTQWKFKLKCAPRRLTLRQLSKHLGKPYSSTQRWAARFGYAFKPAYHNGKNHSR